MVRAERRVKAIQFGLKIIIMGLYAAFAASQAVAISFGTKTLFLSPGDVGLVALVILLGILKVAEGAIIGRLRLGMLSSAKVVIVPLLCLAAVFFMSTLYAAVGPFADEINMARSLLFYVRWLSGLVLLIVCLDSQPSQQQLRGAVVFLSAALVAGFGLSELTPGGFPGLVVGAVGTYTRAKGAFYDPNQLGQAAGMLLILCAALLFTRPTGIRDFPLLLMAPVLGLIVVLTQSREAIITVAISLAVLWYLLAARRKWLAGLVLLVVLVGGSAFALQTPRVAATLTGVRSGEMTAVLNGRDQTWLAAISVFASYPLTGVGFDNLSSFTGGTILQAHNGFLQSAVVSGVLGFVCYTWLLLALTLKFYQWSRAGYGTTTRAVFAGLFSALIGYEVTALVSDHFITFYTYNNLFWGLVGVALASMKTAKGTEGVGESTVARITAF